MKSDAPVATLIDAGEWHVVPGAPIYVFSAYWRNWSRRVMAEIRAAGALSVVRWLEVSLTPISSTPTEWDEIGKMRLRFHGTPLGHGDRISAALPSAVKSMMLSHLEPEVVAFMLQGDIYGSIDFERFRTADRANVRGGGVPIEECQRG